MFYLIGLGLGNAKDITVKGLEIVKSCNRVYLESYTSILTVGKESLESFYGRSVIVADRELVENETEEILLNADKEDVAFLVVGDPFGATTHTDLILRAREKNIKVSIVHNASILNSVGCCGLQLYSYGETISIPFWTDAWTPDSFYEKISYNRQRGLHTLCLLDIKIKEPTEESMMKKVKQYMPPKFMSVSQAADQLMQIFHRRLKAQQRSVFSPSSLTVGLARVGSEEEKIIACSLEKMKEIDFGPPLHCLIIPAEKLHPIESEFLYQYALDKEEFQRLHMNHQQLY